MEQKIKVGFIASTKQFIDCALSVAKKYKIDAVTSMTGLDAAIPAGKKMEREGVEVIISRRGTAALLRKNLKIPVLSVRMSPTDLVQNIRDASLLGQKIILTCLGYEIGDLRLLQDIFGVILIPGVFNDIKSLELVISEGKKQGCQVVIGGGISSALAKKHGLQAIEIQTREDDIQCILEDVVSVVRANREEQAKALRYQTIMDATSEGIVALDKNGVITNINRTALNLLGLTREEVEGKEFFNYLPASTIREVLDTGRPTLNKLEKYGIGQFLVDYFPLLVGSKVMGLVISFRDLPYVVRAENEIRRSMVKNLRPKYSIDDFICQNKIMRQIVEKARKFALSDSTVLITGETGTGKEILAQSMHSMGPRRNGPFVSINCAALPDQLLESELFGYEEGAFTGSRRGGKPGLFELAHKGTIFLDEIGSTTPSMQNRLLRVLQEREVMRVGGDRLIPVNVRVIAATNRNLFQEVQKGFFREDLFFRLAILTIHIPPLRERIDDLPILIPHLISRITAKDMSSSFTIPANYIEKLMKLPWPGNVRQLFNFLEKLIILCKDTFQEEIFAELYNELLEYSPPENARFSSPASITSYDSFMQNNRNEARYIWRTLVETRFCKTLAAKKLGISRTTLWRKIKEMGLENSPPAID